MRLLKNMDLAPLIMWFCLFAGIVMVSVKRIYDLWGASPTYPVYLDVFLIGAYLLWMVLEFGVSKKDVKTKGKMTADFMTCQLYGIGQALTILCGIWFSSIWCTVGPAHWLGSMLFLFGMVYRLWAIRTLGRYYSHRVRTISNHQIVDKGPYCFVRHPAYAGMLIANLGITIYFLNWVTPFVFLFMLLPAIILRIKIEEKILFQIAGYAEFARTRKRLIPLVW